MSRALWLPQALTKWGLTVHATAGWETRGSATFTPRGVVCHHTASAAGADHPSLSIVTNGRPDLNGPLCNVLLARNGDCWLVASGRANHAGEGGWRGLTGNSSMLGIEAENNGTGEPWPAAQIDAYHRLCAAMCDGGRIDVANVCFHREWAPRRKIDPAGPGIPQDGNQWRAAIAAVLHGQGDLTIMDKATQTYLDSHFLAQVIATKKSELALHQLIKRKFAKAGDHDTELDQSIDALTDEIDQLQQQLDEAHAA